MRAPVRSPRGSHPHELESGRPLCRVSITEMHTHIPAHNSAGLIIRNMTESDFGSAEVLLDLAFGCSGSRQAMLRRYLTLQPDGWRLVLRGGTPVGTGGALDYGSFAYLGLMAIHPDCRRQGIGQALMGHLVDWLDARHVPAILLDATPAGGPLYQRFGFVGEDESQWFVGSSGNAPAAGETERARQADLEAIGSFDAPIFGADRLRMLRLLLEEFPKRFLVSRDRRGDVAGYIVAQSTRLGPWVARDPEAAELLLRAAMALPLAGPPTVIAPSANGDAQRLLARCGFTLVRSTRHMRRGTLPHPRLRSSIYGQESFASG